MTQPDAKIGENVGIQSVVRESCFREFRILHSGGNWQDARHGTSHFRTPDQQKGRKLYKDQGSSSFYVCNIPGANSFSLSIYTVGVYHKAPFSQLGGQVMFSKKVEAIFQCDSSQYPPLPHYYSGYPRAVIDLVNIKIIQYFI